MVLNSNRVWKVKEIWGCYMIVKEILIVLPTDLKEIVSPYLAQRAQDVGYSFKTVYRDEPMGEQAVCEAVADVDGYVINLERVTEAVFAAGKKLKSVSKLGVGVDNIDREAARKYGVEVSNCPGSNSNAVAELTLGLMLGMARNTQNLCNNLRNKIWAPEVGFELRGKCVGLLGFGNVGKQLARYLQPFGVQILAYDAFPNEEMAKEYGVTYASLDEIAAESDFISIHLPLLPSTRHVVNAEFLAKTKRGVYVLNMARGGIADEAALYDAVQSGQVSQVATDVFEKEPPFDSPFLEDERFIILPHIGAATKEAILTMLGMAIDNIQSVLEGRGNRHPV